MARGFLPVRGLASEWLLVWMIVSMARLPPSRYLFVQPSVEKGAPGSTFEEWLHGAGANPRTSGATGLLQEERIKLQEAEQSLQLSGVLTDWKWSVTLKTEHQ